MGLNPLWNAPNDEMVKTIITDRNFTISFPEREEWTEEGLHRSVDLTFYTDGSLCEDLAGSGVFSENSELRSEISLGPNISVFQAEILALLECASYCLNEKLSGKRILICSDSKAALLALSSFIFDSRLVMECRERMQSLSENNSVELVWVPGHSGIIGNEIADTLAREGSSKHPIAPIPVLPLSRGWFKSIITKWCFTSHSKFWKGINGCVQAKQLVAEPYSDAEAKRIRSLRKPELRCLVGVITGHFYFNKHLHKMGISSSPICERCGEFEETAYHLVCICPRLSKRRFKIFGDYFISDSKFRVLSVWKIGSFLADVNLRTHL